MPFIGHVTKNETYKSQNNTEKHKYHVKQHMLSNVSSGFMNSGVRQNTIHNLAENIEKVHNRI